MAKSWFLQIWKENWSVFFGNKNKRNYNNSNIEIFTCDVRGKSRTWFMNIDHPFTRRNAELIAFQALELQKLSFMQGNSSVRTSCRASFIHSNRYQIVKSACRGIYSSIILFGGGRGERELKIIFFLQKFKNFTS